MNKKLLTTVVAAASISMAGMAVADNSDSYRMELGGTVGLIDIDAADKKEKTVGLDFTYHFDDVSTVDVPRTEAAFIGKSSNLQVGTTVYTEGEDAFNRDYDLNLGVEGYIENFYLGADFQHAKLDKKYPGAKDKLNDYSVRFGYMFIDGLRAHVAVANGDSYKNDKGKKKADATIGVKYVGDFGGTGQFFNLEGDVTAQGAKDSKNDRVTVFSLRADYFITQDASVGLRTAKSNDTDDDKAFVGIGAQYFVMPTFNIGLELGKKDKDKTVELRLSGRF